MISKLTAHRYIPCNYDGTDWLCGDLHGQLEALKIVLLAAGFDPRRDRLFIMGDIIDRGPHSRELLSWVLSTDWVHSVMGNHELVFVAGSTDARYRGKHRALGGEWADLLDAKEYRQLADQCLKHFPLTITLASNYGTLGLVHAQSPSDNWESVQQAVPFQRFAIDCTWPWNRAQGEERIITGVSAVVSGHIGSAQVIQKGNQVWLDTLEQTGEITIAPINEILSWIKGPGVTAKPSCNDGSDDD